MKIINKRIFFTLTLISSAFLPSLTINVKAKTDIPKAKTWEEDSGNISDGNGGFMFEDSRGNLWSAGNSTPLQKYNYGTNTWESNAKISGNLRSGASGFMFQDKKGNLWSAGDGTSLQKYDYAKESWDSNAKISGKLKLGAGGFMFEDSRRDLWSAGFGTSLQKYDHGTKTWDSSSKTSGKLKRGHGGFMFQDKKGNLWSAGYGVALQKYDYGTSRWESNAKISGNLKMGYDGFMFEDSKGNLWSAGYRTPLQKYDHGTKTWDSSSKTSGNLRSGAGGFMFQDKKGNLWSAGDGTSLQKYDHGTRTWDSSSKTSGNLRSGAGGFMFQDKKGNLWSAGDGTSLQKYDYDTRTWDSSSKTSGNLRNGYFGFMFEDSKGFLWSIGQDTKLQVMYSNKDFASVIALIQANTGMTKDTTDAISPVDIDTPFDVAALSSLGAGGTFPADIRDTTLTYSHGGITSDGDLVVTVKITENDATAKAIFRVQVSGIDAADKLVISKVKNAITAISSVSKKATTDIPLKFGATFDVAAFKALGGTDETFPTNIWDTTLTYSHGSITNDGNLKVIVKVTKGWASADASFIVAVHGINFAKVKKEVDKFKNFNSTDSLNSVAAILPLNVENVKTQFEAITGYNPPSLTGGYSISRVIVKTALNTKTRKVVYIVTTSDTKSNTATKDIVVTFANNAISKDKDLSGGAIAGITIGFILGIGILGFLIYYYFKKLKKQK